MTDSSPLSSLTVLPIPDEALVLSSALLANPEQDSRREERRLALAALRQAMVESRLDFPLGPEIDPLDPDRLLALNHFAVQLATTGFGSDVVPVAREAWRTVVRAPQLLLAAAVDVEQAVVFFPGVLTPEELLAALEPRARLADPLELPMEVFQGGIERLFTLVVLLQPEAIRRRALQPEPAPSPAIRVLDWLDGLLAGPLEQLGATMMPVTAGAFRQAVSSRAGSAEGALVRLSIPLGLTAASELICGEAAARCGERFALELLPCGSAAMDGAPSADRLVVRLVAELEGDLLPDGLVLKVQQGDRCETLRSAGSTVLELTLPAAAATIAIELTAEGGTTLTLPPLRLELA